MGHMVGCILGMFYAYDGLQGSWDLERLQGALNNLIALFWRIKLEENVAKSKTMTLHTGATRLGMLVEAFGWISTGKGEIYR